MSVTGEPDGPPVKVGAAVVDVRSGLIAAIGILAALVERAAHRRRPPRRGRRSSTRAVDVPAQRHPGTAWVAAGVTGRRRGNRHPSIVPYETYATADRPLAIAVGNERIFVRLCEALGLPELPGDPRFASNEVRVEHADALMEAFEAVLTTQPAEHWLEVLRAAKVPAGPINGVDEAFALASELGMEPVEDVDGLPVIRPPLRVDGERPPIRHAPPGLDEHGDELRAWLAAHAARGRRRAPARLLTRLHVRDDAAVVQERVNQH